MRESWLFEEVTNEYKVSIAEEGEGAPGTRWKWFGS